MARSDPSLLQPFLDRLGLHARLTSMDRQAILDLPAVQLGVGARRDLYQAGDGLTHCCLVLSGILARFIQNHKGERQLTALNMAGDMVDLDSIVCRRAITGLTTLTSAIVCHVPHDALRSITRRHTGIAEALWSECVASGAHLPRWTMLLARSSARTRVAELLCHVALRLGRPNDPALTFALPITQDQLSEATGLTPVHVNRVLRGLRMDRIVTFRSGRVQIGDWTALAREAELGPVSLCANDNWNITQH